MQVSSINGCFVLAPMTGLLSTQLNDTLHMVGMQCKEILLFVADYCCIYRHVHDV
jgi:hypothetical protein